MLTRRNMLKSTAALLGGGGLLGATARLDAAPAAEEQVHSGHPAKGARPPASPARDGYTPVVTPNGSTLPWKVVGGVKEFHLIAETIKHEVSPGMVINAWGYNGQTPSWVSIHHGGGVGIGRSIHAGQVTVADGTTLAAEKIERVLTNDPGMGVIRHVDAGYDIADRVAHQHDVRIPMRES